MTIATRPAPGIRRDYEFPPFTRHQLENGISVIIAPASRLPLVSIVTVVDVSALLDFPDKQGLAELTAQAIREGTQDRDGATLTLDLERLGTSLETGADWDSTIAAMTVLKDRLPKAFGILAEVLQSPAFREEDIQRLKAERLAERMQILDEPRGLADESFARFVYAAGSRYSEPMSGSARSVSAITRSDVVGFYEKHYLPSAVTVILAGDIGADEGIELVSSTLGLWKGKRSLVTVEADESSRSSNAVQIISKPKAAQSELRIGHRGVPRSHPDYFPIVVMNAILGGLFSSRINLNLREKHGYTYGASSYFDWRRQAGPFVISTAVQSEVTAAAISEVMKEIEAMRDREVGEEELSLATSYLEGVFPIRYETTSAIASALAGMVTFSLPEDYFNNYRANIAAVTPESVLAAAREHVRPDQLQVTVVGDTGLIQEGVEALQLGPMSVREVVEG
ncbi:MAG: pitrilysin family protein [Gemmatimonadaceae bacterium]